MMKKKLLFFMFVALASWGWGQSLSYESLKISTGFAASNGLVRSWTPTSAVVYYRDASQGVLVCQYR